ncbi:MAG: hypothetical protein OEY44_02870, partial [Candidatus Peregrinibacteria bacterium]|nr:hypothetical protein [Candidatus Peregrinibacteria bacterium]
MALAFVVSSQLAFAESYSPDNSAKPDPLTSQKQSQGLSVGEFTGAAIYEYSLTLPLGRTGMTPSVTLTYNGQDESLDNLLGYHWSLTDFSIRRVNKTGVEKLYEENHFIASTPFESGELIVLDLTDDSHGSYSQRFEASFARYEFLPENKWVVTDKGGTKYIFGQTEQARSFDPKEPARTAEWKLEEIRDTHDNFIRYQYYRSGNKLYPKTIRYTGNGTEEGVFEVRFLPFVDNQSGNHRPDSHFSFATGFRVDSDHLMTGVEIYADAKLVRKYEIEQGGIQNFERQTLLSITETGYDQNGTATTLPPTTFDYSESEIKWEETTDYAPNWIFEYCSKDYGCQSAGGYHWDMTGDGLVDFEYGGGDKFYRAINDGKGGWKIGSAGYFTSAAVERIPSTRTKALDFNGDVRADLVSSFLNLHDDKLVSTLNLLGKGGFRNTIDVALQDDTSGMYKTDNGASIADLNGDGLTDIIQGRKYWFEYNIPDVFSTCLNQDGEACRLTDLWKSPITITTDGPDSQNSRFVYVQDCNYDGLADVHSSLAGGSSWINDGKGGWIENAPGKCHFTMMDELVRRSFDANGDGLIDRIYSEKKVMPSGYKIYNELFIGGQTGAGEILKNIFPIYFNNGWSRYFHDGGVRILDLNGDNLPDVMKAFKEYDGKNDPVTIQKVFLNKSTKPYILKTIHTSSGARIDLEYKPSTQYIRADGSQANPQLPIIVETVSRMTVDDGMGNVASTNYFYEDGHYYFDNSYDRNFAGFRVVSKTDALGYKTKTYYHQSQFSTSDSGKGEYQDHISKKGRVYRSETYDKNGTLASLSINRWDKKDLGADHFFPFMAQALNQTFDGGVTKSTAKAYTYDAYGNQTQVIDYGEVTATDNSGSFSDLGNDLIKTISLYASDNGSYLVAYPYESKVFDQVGVLLSHARTYYDGLTLGQIEKGAATAQEAWFDTDDSWIRSETEYNAYGLPIRQINPRGYSTQTIYDAYHLYPEKVTNAKGHVMQNTYLISTGQMEVSVDPNGSLTKNIYDGLGRLLRVQRDGKLISETIYNDVARPRSIHSIAYNDDGEKVESYSYLDALDRNIESKQEAPGGKWIASQIIYDERGNVTKQIQPYFSSSSAFESLNSGRIGTSFIYDALGRTTSVTNPLGTTKTSYRGWEVLTTDPLGNTRMHTQDARGNLIRVTENEGSASYDTVYNYDPLGRLTQIRDAQNNVRSLRYDSLGRRTFQSVIGGSAGWTYEYDDNGNLITKKDPKGQRTSFTYDQLDRPLTEQDLSFEYDSGANAIGRLSKVSKPGYEHSMEYDLWGRVLRDSKVIDGEAFETAFTYDQMGAITALTYPDGSMVDYGYDGAHQLARVGTYASDFVYTPLGQVTQMTLGNNVVTVSEYDENQMYRLKAKTASNSLQDYRYSYDALGNLLTLEDQNLGGTSKTVNYQYDDLYRLTQAAYTGTAEAADLTLDYAYDAIGNMMSKSDVGAFSYGG